MKPVERTELMDLKAYEAARNDFRAKVMAHKDKRRVYVGDVMNFLFETNLTMHYQVQEMMRAEQITAEAAIQHELDTYNELVPPDGELAASLLIEYEEPAVRDVQLKKLMGLHEHVFFQIGEMRCKAEFDQRQMGEDRLSSVQYVRFPLSQAQREAWLSEASRGKVALVIDHPEFEATAILSPVTAAVLAQDFTSGLN